VIIYFLLLALTTAPVAAKTIELKGNSHYLLENLFCLDNKNLLPIGSIICTPESEHKPYKGDKKIQYDDCRAEFKPTNKQYWHCKTTF
jgi:hypothetical protein